MVRRSLLAGLGVASCAALGSLVPASAKAHHHNDDDCYGNDPKDVVYGLLGSFEMLDVEELASWLDDDIVYENTGLPDVNGKAGVVQFLSLLAPAFESCTVDVVNLVSKKKGNKTLVCAERVEHFVISQTPPIGIPGAEFTLKVTGWFEVKHGEVIRWSDYWDTQSFSTALGLPLPT